MAVRLTPNSAARRRDAARAAVWVGDRGERASVAPSATARRTGPWRREVHPGARPPPLDELDTPPRSTGEHRVVPVTTSAARRASTATSPARRPGACTTSPGRRDARRRVSTARASAGVGLAGISTGAKPAPTPVKSNCSWCRRPATGLWRRPRRPACHRRRLADSPLLDASSSATVPVQPACRWAPSRAPRRSPFQRSPNRRLLPSPRSGGSCRFDLPVRPALPPAEPTRHPVQQWPYVRRSRPRPRRGTRPDQNSGQHALTECRGHRRGAVAGRLEQSAQAPCDRGDHPGQHTCRCARAAPAIAGRPCGAHTAAKSSPEQRMPTGWRPSPRAPVGQGSIAP